MLKPEQIFQINLINWLAHNYPDAYEDSYHFANERKCTAQQGALLKKMGVKRGVADMFIAIPNSRFAGLWLELKTETGRLSTEQKEFLSRMNKRGYQALCVRNIETAKIVIESYLSLI